MRVTINLNNNVLNQVMHYTNAKNRSQAVNEILEAYVKEKRMQMLLDLKGKLHLENNWENLRKMELNEA